ncbi:MAG: hypothetical protein QOD77_422 [Thermoplasmata archaeon]|jgi:hypothetical protein|nr:hypothetical protein [Thermoplasmata archaeon]
MAVGLAAVAVLGLGLLMLAPDAQAQGAAINTPFIQVGLHPNGDFRYICGSTCPPICNDNAVRILYHLAGGAGDCNLNIAGYWGVSFTNPTYGLRTATCSSYDSGNGVCAPFISPPATMASTGFSYTGAVGSATSVTANNRLSAPGDPVSPLIIQHVLTPSTSANLARADVTITNTDPSGTFSDIHYRRTFAFTEMRHPPGAPPPGGPTVQSLSTNTKLWIEGDYPPPSTLRCTSNVGFAHGAPQTNCVNGLPDFLHGSNTARCEDDGRLSTHPNPPIPPGAVPAGPPTVSPVPGPGTATLGLAVPWTAGPTGYVDCGQGALFEFALGSLGPGESLSFTIFLGGVMATGSVPDALNDARDILRSVGAEFWSIAEPATVSNTTWATSMVGFHGLYRPAPTVTWSTTIPGWTVPAPFTPGVTVCLGEAATFSDTYVHTSYPIASSEWDFETDGTVDATFPGSGTPSHTYPAVGSYTVTVNVEDTAGWTGTGTATVVVKQCRLPPVASFIASGGANCIDSRVLFDASASYDPDGGPLTYTWNFGDGSANGTGVTVFHQYLNDNPLTVTLTVLDNEGVTGVATMPYPPPGDPNCLPNLDPLPEVWVSPGEVFTVQLHAVDSDGPGLSFEGAATLGGTVNSLVVTPPPTQWEANGDFVFTVPGWPAGRYELPFRAFDGIAYDQEILVLRVRGIVEDTDSDGVADPADNCPGIVNLDQADGDKNGVGDACQGPDGKTIDFDGDGVPDTSDLCPTVPNPDQQDTDLDGIGDACERLGLPNDADADGWLDVVDNCPARPNEDQKDLDKDGAGDLCDPDADGDHVSDVGKNADNCLRLPNPDQLDADQDGEGNACDQATDQPPTGLAERKRPLGDLQDPSSRSFLLLVGIGPAVLAGVLLLALWRRKRKEQERQP